MTDGLEAFDLMKRAGILEDPETSPYVDRGDVEFSTEEKIIMLEGAGLLTNRQAEAYVRRRIEEVPRLEASQQMEISPSTLDDYVRAADEKITNAWTTTKVADFLGVWD